MSITYTNRKGKNYTLCQGVTKTGKPRYYFTPNPIEGIVERLPDGYEIRENVNGQVSLARKTQSPIQPAELAQLKRALKKALKPDNYRADIKGKQIILYELVGPDVDELFDLFSEIVPFVPGGREGIRQKMDTRSQFSPMIRFTLIDKEQRLFEAKRIRYSGEPNTWRHIGSGKLADLLAKIVPTLDTDAYYELY